MERATHVLAAMHMDDMDMSSLQGPSSEPFSGTCPVAGSCIFLKTQAPFIRESQSVHGSLASSCFCYVSFFESRKTWVSAYPCVGDINIS